MKKNFLIEDSIAIRYGDNYYDLHNCYDMQGLFIGFNQMTSVELNFRKSEGDWIKPEDPQAISLHFYNIQYLEVSKDFWNMNSTNIEEIGYKQKDDQDYDWLEQEEKSDETEHIIIRFESNDYIRIFCEYIEVKIEIS